MSHPILSPGLESVRAAAARLGIDLPSLVAEVAIWVPAEIHARYVSPVNPSGAVYPSVRRARLGSGERAGEIIDGIRLDRNNYAGAALREALGGRGKTLAGYQACHLWPETCYDPRYHTALANLVLVPAPLVSLTDHDPDVIACLQFRAFELYGWHPAEAPPPTRPACYPLNWRAPQLPERRHRNVVSAPLVTGEIPPVRTGTQRALMRKLWDDHGGDRDAVVRAWVKAEGRSEASRRSNERGMSAEEYAKRLIYNGLRTGWLR